METNRCRILTHTPAGFCRSPARRTNVVRLSAIYEAQRGTPIACAMISAAAAKVAPTVRPATRDAASAAS